MSINKNDICTINDEDDLTNNFKFLEYIFMDNNKNKEKIYQYQMKNLLSFLNTFGK